MSAKAKHKTLNTANPRFPHFTPSANPAYPDTDGIFLMSDELIAASSLLLQKKYGKQPEACTLVAISDGLMPQIIDFPVNYFHHNGFELGQLAATNLFRRIKEGASEAQNPVKSLLEVQLIAGGG